MVLLEKSPPLSRGQQGANRVKVNYYYLITTFFPLMM